jgi:hypothetical protein
MRHLILLLSGSLAVSAYAQRGHDLKVETYLLPSESISKSLIAVRLTNISPHELEIPSDNVVIAEHPIPASPIKALYYAKSTFSCSPLPGSISASFQFKAQNPEEVTRCAEVGAIGLTGSGPTLLERVTSWTILRPRESTTRQAKITSVLPIQAGWFTSIRTVYTSPSFSADEQKILKEAGIHVPSGNYVSDNSLAFWTDGKAVFLADPGVLPTTNPPKLRAAVGW